MASLIMVRVVERYAFSPTSSAAVLTVLSFYANYATLHFDVPLAVAAGVFVACIYSGSITVNIVLGAMNLLSLKQKFVLGKTITLSLLLILIFFPSLTAFFLVSYLLGFVRAIRNMVYAPAVKNFCNKVDVTPYYFLAPILTLPVAVGYPLLFGRLLDLLAGLGADSYRVVFGLSFLFISLTLILSFSLTLQPRPRPREADRGQPLAVGLTRRCDR